MSIRNIGDSPADYIDLSWDYATIFKLLVEFQHEVESTIGIISSKEFATAETDINLKVGIECLMRSLLEIQQKVK